MEKEMASILAWIISWTGQPGRLQSMGHRELATTEQRSLTHSLIILMSCGSVHWSGHHI